MFILGIYFKTLGYFAQFSRMYWYLAWGQSIYIYNNNNDDDDNNNNNNNNHDNNNNICFQKNMWKNRVFVSHSEHHLHFMVGNFAHQCWWIPGGKHLCWCPRESMYNVALPLLVAEPSWVEPSLGSPGGSGTLGECDCWYVCVLYIHIYIYIYVYMYSGI